MNLHELQALYTEAVKIVHAEKRMRAYVFRHKPLDLALKMAEIQRLEIIITTLKDALKACLTPADQPEQQPLLDVPPKYP